MQIYINYTLFEIGRVKNSSAAGVTLTIVIFDGKRGWYVFEKTESSEF